MKGSEPGLAGAWWCVRCVHCHVERPVEATHASERPACSSARTPSAVMRATTAAQVSRDSAVFLFLSAFHILFGVQNVIFHVALLVDRTRVKTSGG
eukprot:scaffold7494_cov79-Phaeocystis_antarctica.AAC.3